MKASRMKRAAAGGEGRPSAALDYPIALRLHGQPVLVVGGGRVASGRISPLVEVGARVRVVAERARGELRALGESNAIDLHERRWRPEDCAGMSLVFAATDSPRVNAEVVREARSRGLLANACDLPELCDFYVPAIGRRGPVTIAVSTAGAVPGLARTLRDRAMSAIGPEWGRLARILRALRRALPRDTRAATLARIIDSPAASHLASGNRKAAFAAVRAATATGESR